MIVPMPGKLLVQRLELPDVSEGGIALVHGTPLRESLQRGIVIAVGEPVTLASGDRVESSVSPGDTVVFPYRAGEEFKIGGEKLLLMDESDVRAIEGEGL